MTQIKLTFFFLLLSLLLFGCKENRNKNFSDSLKDDFIKELVEKQIGKTNLFISIPNNYTIKVTDGPDFSVYYFYPTDTTIQAHLSGGFYLGNCPSHFPPDNDSCKNEKSISKILNQQSEWTIYSCNDEYVIQAIVDTKSSNSWGQLIHAFGKANSKADLIKLFSIYSTMKIKK